MSVALNCRGCEYSLVYTQTSLEELEAGMSYNFGLTGYTCPRCKRFGVKPERIDE